MSLRSSPERTLNFLRHAPSVRSFGIRKSNPRRPSNTAALIASSAHVNGIMLSGLLQPPGISSSIVTRCPTKAQTAKPIAVYRYGTFQNSERRTAVKQTIANMMPLRLSLETLTTSPPQTWTTQRPLLAQTGPSTDDSSLPSGNLYQLRRPDGIAASRLSQVAYARLRTTRKAGSRTSESAGRKTFLRLEQVCCSESKSPPTRKLPLQPQIQVHVLLPLVFEANSLRP